jgi:hypothetical protein
MYVGDSKQQQRETGNKDKERPQTVTALYSSYLTQMLFTVEIRRKRGRWGAISCLCSRTVHVLLWQGAGQKGWKRLGQQPSHVTSGSARYTRSQYRQQWARSIAMVEENYAYRILQGGEGLN